jgi:hypothetical protein
MAKQKITLTEKMLRGSHILVNYDKATKLYGRYQKDKANPRKEPALKEELLSEIKSATETLERFHRVYKSVNEEMEAELAKRKDKGESLFPTSERKSYLMELELRLEQMKKMQNELAPTQAKPNIIASPELPGLQAGKPGLKKERKPIWARKEKAPNQPAKESKQVKASDAPEMEEL